MTASRCPAPTASCQTKKKATNFWGMWAVLCVYHKLCTLLRTRYTLVIMAKEPLLPNSRFRLPESHLAPL